MSNSAVIRYEENGTRHDFRVRTGDWVAYERSSRQPVAVGRTLSVTVRRVEESGRKDVVLYQVPPTDCSLIL